MPDYRCRQRYWPRYLNRSVLAGLLCALLMLGLVVRLALWTEPKVALLVTTADLPIGAVLEAGHLDTTEATLDEAIASGYLRRAELADVLERRALPASRELVTIVPGTMGADAPLLGAAEHAFEPLLADPAARLAVIRARRPAPGAARRAVLCSGQFPRRPGACLS